MIEGQVDDQWEALVRVEVRGPTGRRRTVTAIVDTGFNGFLTLPRMLIEQLELEWDSVGSAILADDSTVSFDVYVAKVRWDGRLRSIRVDCSGSTALIGMRLLEGYELRLQALTGGSVTIEALR